jgi:adenosylcobinamide kinase/adenosylcobinamide-phosphate guanylyltransferase
MQAIGIIAQILLERRMKYLVLGGMRSGKSRHAENWATETGLDVCYIATAQALDAEMDQRIEHHRQQRPAHWALVEEPLALAAAIRREAAEDRCLLVDCLTLWLSNLLMKEYSQAEIAEKAAELVQAVAQAPGKIVLVSNEVGLGVIPMGELSRVYCDEAGRLHQALAAECGQVSLLIAGLCQRLKG